MDFKRMYRDLIVSNYFIFKYNLGLDDVSSVFLEWETDNDDLELPN